MPRAIVFDGDDTLWETEPLYDEARTAARRVVEATGLNGAVWEAREREIDVENVDSMGHATDRFPTSCIQAYEEVCGAIGCSSEDAVRERIDAAARSVFERRAPLFPGAMETLDALRDRGYVLALLTKGDPSVQERRVKESGLVDRFDLIEIVEDKTPSSMLGVLEQLDAGPAESFAVGNSVRSDILPSLAAGLTPVWIDAHVWDYERQHGEIPEHTVIEGKEITDLLRILPL